MSNSKWIVSSMVEVAKFFGISETIVRKEWRARGMPGENGSYALDEIAQWRVGRVRESAPAPEDSELAKRHEAAELLKIETDAKHRELKYLKEAGEVVNKAEAMAEIEEMFHRIRARLEQVPQELGTTIPPDIRADLIADMRHKIHLVLRELEAWGD